jgi:hypothetical protein
VQQTNIPATGDEVVTWTLTPAVSFAAGEPFFVAIGCISTGALPKYQGGRVLTGVSVPVYASDRSYSRDAYAAFGTTLADNPGMTYEAAGRTPYVQVEVSR